MKGQGFGRYYEQNATRRLTRAATVAVLLLTGAAVAPVTQATATTTEPSPSSMMAAPNAAACQIDAGSVTAGGDERSQLFLGAARSHNIVRARHVHAPGLVKLSGELQLTPAKGYQVVAGRQVLGSYLNFVTYPLFDGEDEPYEVIPRQIGGGWSPFVAMTDSRRVDSESKAATDRLYALRNDGVLFRWTITQEWRMASYGGFGAVKSMTLFSRTSSYDTLLITTRGGALQTVRIPTTTPMKPTIKTLRPATWQGFETLMASRCGQYGSMLLGIDKDTGFGFMYGIGHANGEATVIKALGKVNGTFTDAVNFRWTGSNDLPLYGE
jgi:hypothetical protein